MRLDKEGAWIRVRDEGEQITLTFKKRLGFKTHDGTANDEGMEEVEVIVNDFDKTAELLSKIGLKEKHYIENRRIRYLLNGVEFDIDSYPQLKPFLEIEARSWDKIDEAINWLGLNPADKKIFSTNQVYRLNGIEESEYSRITFEEMVKRVE
ncbi:MAG: CYTH domain-containing protein [bacterium]